MKNFINLFFVLAIMLPFIFACGNAGSGNNPEKTASTTSEKPDVDGAKIYKLNCTVCHGVDGTMGASGAFNLVTSTLTVEERIAVIKNGRNTMTPFGNILSEDKIKAVAEYTMTLKQ